MNIKQDESILFKNCKNRIYTYIHVINNRIKKLLTHYISVNTQNRKANVDIILCNEAQHGLIRHYMNNTLRFYKLKNCYQYIRENIILFQF